MKKFISCIVLSAMICGCLASCGGEESSKEDKDSSSTVETTEAPTEAEEATEAEAEKATEAEGEESVPQAVVTDIEVEPSIAAESGDAYLAIVDGQWWIQYWGANDNADQTMLTYNAGVVPITGNGDYTVSVTSETVGFRLDTTGDANDDSCIPGGLEFMSVMIKDGETKFPGAVITVNEVRIDGTPVTLSSKAYTSSDDGIETRANIFNKYVNEPSTDGRCVDGALYDEDGNALDICSEYSPQIVSSDDFASWKTVEVDFTVSGIAE